MISVVTDDAGQQSPVCHDRDAAAPRGTVTRVAVGKAWVVHGFCLEFSSGFRIGTFLNDDKTAITDLSVDSKLKERYVEWKEINDGEHIIAVSGDQTTFDFLCARIVFHTDKGRELEFKG